MVTLLGGAPADRLTAHTIIDVGMASLSGNSTRTVAELYRQTIRACAKQGEVHVSLVDGRIQGVVAWIASGQDWQC